MWIMLNNAFLSIVAHRDQPDNLCVRARVAGDIEAVFPGAEVTHTPNADYAYRSVLSRALVAQDIAINIRHAINYDNFKNSVSDNDRHEAYLRCWGAMRDLQTMKAKKAVKYKKAKV